MNALIEDYLRARGVRYFRGHHDDEYFFLVDLPVDFHVAAARGRLHVHLGVSGLLRDTVQLSITADRYYRADKRDRLTGMAARWTAHGNGAEAVVHDSCDPALIGIAVHDRFRPADSAGLAGFVDHAIASATELFEQVTVEALPSQQVPKLMRDAG